MSAHMRHPENWRRDVAIADARADRGTMCDACQTRRATVIIRSPLVYVATFRCDAPECRAIEAQIQAAGHLATVDPLVQPPETMRGVMHLEKRTAVQACAIPAVLAVNPSGGPAVNHQSTIATRESSMRFLAPMSPEDVEHEIATSNARTATWIEQRIATVLADDGMPYVKVAYVEAWIRLSCPTLDHLTLGEMDREIRFAIACALESTDEHNRQLAVSLGVIV